MLGSFNDDKTVYHEAWLDTVLWPALKGKTEAEALVTPGACVMSVERAGSGFPAYHGKLVSYDEPGDRVVVRSHEDGICEPRRVWTGTVAEYHACWRVD